MESQNNTSVKYYYSEKDNKAVKITPDNVMIYYQIKQYESGEIKHSYGKTTVPSSERLQVELKDFAESTKEQYESVMKSYYNKEQENMLKVRNHFNKQKA